MVDECGWISYSRIVSNHIPINVHVWSPLEKSLFKFPAKDPATCEVFYCEKADTCELLKRGQCINKTFWGPKCPHGYISKESGPTKQSKKCHDWVQKKRAEFAHVKNRVSGSPPAKMVEIGDWIYLPYAHMDMNKNLPIEGHSSLFIPGRPFMQKSIFTVAVIKTIVDFHPQALLGGEITSYQKEVVPKFLAHLQEIYPDLYKQLMEANPHYVERYALTTKSYIGRLALLKTTNPHTIVTGKHTFQWDGTRLTSLVFDPLWIDIQDQNQRKAIDKIDVTIVPSDKAVVKITSNEQVSPTTVFVD
jgi:hypothetical protein